MLDEYRKQWLLNLWRPEDWRYTFLEEGDDPREAQMFKLKTYMVRKRLNALILYFILFCYCLSDFPACWWV